jgi:hypothetical protein
MMLKLQYEYNICWRELVNPYLGLLYVTGEEITDIAPDDIVPSPVWVTDMIVG